MSKIIATMAQQSLIEAAPQYRGWRFCKEIDNLPGLRLCFLWALFLSRCRPFLGLNQPAHHIGAPVCIAIDHDS
jgi:hypothetical protein